MAYLRNKLTEWIPALLAAVAFSVVLTPAGDALPVQTWTFEGICRELVAGTTEGRQALVGSLWHAPLPTLVGLPGAALLPRGASIPLVARGTTFLALFFLAYTLLRFCRRQFSMWPAMLFWLACLLLLARLPGLTTQPQMAVTLAVAAATVLKFADWFDGRRLGDLVKFSFALALLALCGAHLAGWTLLLALLLPLVALLDPALRPRLQGLLILGLLPVLYAMSIWLLMSRLMLADAIYPWRALIHTPPAWTGWPAAGMAPHHLGAVACCALLGGLAACRRDRRTALLGVSGVALLVWHTVLQGYGLAWATGPAAGLLTLMALLTLASALGVLAARPHTVPLRHRLAVAGVGLVFLALCIPPRGSSPTLAMQDRQTQRRLLDAVEHYVESRTPYGRVFICSYRGLGLLEGDARERFVACLDLHVDALRERYHRQNLFLLVPRPEADAAFECAVWRYHDIYGHGAARALFAGDWGDWRLYEIITAPTADELLEWRQRER
ncbi:MAG: hypothetical protein GX590_03125 [Lentisphaerae bacterium]|nr:hypothetical protein [Lentisphaerota bacterium]